MHTNLIFNPFTRIAGYKALTIGVIGMLIAGYVSFYSHTHFDGVLNIHSGLAAPIWIHILWPFADVAFLGIWFTLLGIILSQSKIRIVDIFGTQAFAFLPLVPASLMGFSKSLDRLSEKLMGVDPKAIRLDMFPLNDILMVLIIILITIPLTVWSGILIYNGFKESANLPHKKVIPVYIAGIFIGMILPKFLIGHFLLN
ncbi:MAG: hypothetical protein WCX31_20830 [Salinivirgaceae bacterium]